MSGHVPAKADDAPFVVGEITKVDKESGRLTIRHGPIPHLQMSMGMTMVFKVTDPAITGTVQAGDKVEFKAERIRGDLTVTEIRK